MDMASLLRDQAGVISRRQVHQLGGDDNLVERMVRRKEWKPLHPGVYVEHTGPATSEQLRMAAVLHAWPAALAGESALIAHGVRNVSVDGIRIAVDATRRVRPGTGVSVLRMRDLDSRALWNRTPPRVRLEDAALETASRWRAAKGEAAAVALLADLRQQGPSTPTRLLGGLEQQTRLTGRSFLRALLADVACGAYSVLEQRYLSRVERAHGLPRAERQGAFDGPERSGFRDVHYPAQRLVLELDGRLGHEFAADQWADLERDVLAACEELLTVRVGWGAVIDACRLAGLVGRLLTARGWRGQVRRCPNCPVSGVLSAPGAGNVPLIG